MRLTPSTDEAKRLANAARTRRYRARLRGEDVPRRKPGSAPSNPRERFERLVEKSGECWIWTGARSPNGYGEFYVDGGPRPAHRASYEMHVGPIAAGLHIDHLCRTPLCVNPEHLEPVTQAENNRRAAAVLTHCKHGHEFTPENRTATGKCRPCQKIRNDARPRKRAAA